MACRKKDMIIRAVETGVGIHVSAEAAHRIADAALRVVAASLKEHVFEKVGQTAAEAGAFMYTSGLYAQLSLKCYAAAWRNAGGEAVFVTPGEKFLSDRHIFTLSLIRSLPQRKNQR